MLTGMAQTTMDEKSYTYSRIADLKAGIHNIYGVVKFCKAPVKSRGTDFIQVLSITDDSLAGGKLVISLFHSSIKDCPSPVVGDVIRFHRLRVESINDALKGRPAPGFSWLLVHEDVDTPTTSSKKYTYTDQSKKRIRELQQWAKEQRWRKDPSASDTLSNLCPTEYCDLVCQVVGTAVEQEGVCFIARVWDGTKCPHLTSSSGEELKTIDHALEELTADLTVDIWIYDDHVPSCQAIQPGDFIKLCNLHAALYKGEKVKDSADSLVLELTLHRGTSYGRRVFVLDQDCPQVAAVKERMHHFLSGKSAPEISTEESDQAYSDSDTAAQWRSQGQNATAHGTKEGESLAAVRSRLHTVTEAAQPGCSYWGENEYDKKDHHQKDYSEKDHHQDDQYTATPTQDYSSQATVTSSTDDTEGPSPSKRMYKGQRNENSPILVSSSTPDDESQATPGNVPDHQSRVHQKSEEGGGDSGDSSSSDIELGAALTGSGSGGKEQQTSLQSSTEMCMLQTATVITDHQHISHTPIRSVLCHEVPSKFRVLAHLVNFHPDTVDPWQFVKLFCPNCMFLAKASREATSNTSETGTDVARQQSVVKSITSSITSRLAGFIGGRFVNWNPENVHTPENSYLCPRCKSDGKMVALELIYMLRLVLKDSSGKCLLANLWRDHAVTFFRGVSPETALKSPGVVEDMVQTLQSLCVGETPHEIGPSSLPPCLDCCLFSYTTGTMVNFHIFDTVLV